MEMKKCPMEAECWERFRKQANEFGILAGQAGELLVKMQEKIGEWVGCPGIRQESGAVVPVVPVAQMHADFTLKIDNFLNAEGAQHIDRIVEGVQWLFDHHVRGGRLVCVLFALVKLGYVVDAHFNYMPGFVMLVNYALSERKEKMMKTAHNRTLFDPGYDCFRYHPFHLFTGIDMLREELGNDRLLKPKEVEKALKWYEADVKNMNDFLTYMALAA